MLQETTITRAITKLSNVRSKFNLNRSDDSHFFTASTEATYQFVSTGIGINFTWRSLPSVG
ncbi:MAG: hypothetical protein Fur006_19240 [Coleofasciculaceae cyanobacterium]